MAAPTPPVSRDLLVFANGDVNDGPMVRRALDAVEQPLVIAADGGARVAGYFGLRPQRVIGDLDSLAPHDLRRLEAQGVVIDRYPMEKDETDLELALVWAAAQLVPSGRIVIVGGIGDRFDQTLANVQLLALPDLMPHCVKLVAGKQAIRLLRPGTHNIDGAAGDTVSLLPLDGAARVASTEGLHYPLHADTLRFGPARGISNVMTTAHARVTLDTGLLLLVHTVGRA